MNVARLVREREVVGWQTLAGMEVVSVAFWRVPDSLVCPNSLEGSVRMTRPLSPNSVAGGMEYPQEILHRTEANLQATNASETTRSPASWPEHMTAVDSKEFLVHSSPRWQTESGHAPPAR